MSQKNNNIYSDSKSTKEFVLNADLTFATVCEQRIHLRLFIQNSAVEEPIIVNLSAVQRSDSAGLALMIEALRFSRQLKKEILFKAVPEQMRTMMRFCNVLSLFKEEKWTN